jgi:hypothetical protein
MQKDDHVDDSQDFFKEIQDKVEQDIFSNELQSEQASSEQESKTGDAEADRTETSGVDVQIEIVGSESDSDDMDIDENFLEEIDVLEEDEGETSWESRDQVATDGPAHMDIPGAPADLKSVEEDDRYMGELIRQEMVEQESDPDIPCVDAFPVEAPFAGLGETSSHEEKEFTTRTLGDLYAEQGHTDKALEVYENLLREDPENQEIALKIQELRSQLASSEEPTTDEASASGFRSEGSRKEQILRLEAWLAQIRTEGEKRCLRSC